MTNKQRLVLTKFEDTIISEVRHHLTLAKEAYEAGNISLPMTGENGEPVIHRDRKNMYNICDMHMTAARAFCLTRLQELELDKEFGPEWQRGKFPSLI